MRSLRAAGALFCAAVITLSLSACQLLFGGPFSGLLVQTTARQDLSGVVSASSASKYRLGIIKSGSVEFVLLYSSSITDPSQNWLIVLSPDLKVLSAYPGSALNALPPGATPFSGTGIVSHLVDGTVAIGDMSASPSGGTLVPTSILAPPNTGVYVQLQGPTIVGPLTATLTWTGFMVDPSGALSWTTYASDWSSSVPGSVALGRPVQLSGVFTDPQDASHNVAFFAFSDSSGTLSIIQVPKDPDLVNSFPSGLWGNPSYPVVTKGGLQSGDVHMTQDSVIGFEGSSDSWVRFSPSNPTAESRLAVGNRPSGQVTEFSFAGGYFCIWDPTTRMLTRAEDWW